MPSTMSLPSYLVNYTSGTIIAPMEGNSSRTHMLTILSHTTAHPVVVAGQGSDQDGKVSGGSGSNSDEDDDSFGEHYFHICIYIWVCVVVSSLIALSVKWGCCGRSLTRWEVKRIPLKRFQRVEGEDSQEKCPICHEEFHEERLIRQLPCNHCYHSYCVDRWLVKMSNRCPLCKQRVSISLLCPWNKQRRKKEFGGSLASEVEASVDESPPLPPLATLTPTNWFGEEIMSGPSKFIIMRPGRPTRVIDMREQKKAAAASRSCGDRDQALQAVEGSHSASSQNFEIVPEQSCGASAWEGPNFPAEAKVAEGDDDIAADAQIPTACVSRSCSICSDQPLLVQNQFSSDTCSKYPEADSKNKDGKEQIQTSDILKWCIDLKPLMCSQESHSHCACERDNCPMKLLRDVDRGNGSEATVTLSSRSSSVVSCTSTRTSEAKLDFLNTPSSFSSSSDRTHAIVKHSVSSEELDWSNFVVNCLPASSTL